MKPEEMSSDELADCIESARLAPAKYLSCEDLGFHGAAIREAATRLRMMDAMSKALDIEVGMNKVAAKETVKLRRILKLAMEALKFVNGSITKDCGNDCDHANLCYNSGPGCLCRKKIDAALDEIRKVIGDDDEDETNGTVIAEHRKPIIDEGCEPFVVFVPDNHPDVSMVIRRNRVEDGRRYFAKEAKAGKVIGMDLGSCLTKDDIEFINDHSSYINLKQTVGSWRIQFLSFHGEYRGWSNKLAHLVVKELNEAISIEKRKVIERKS